MTPNAFHWAGWAGGAGRWSQWNIS